jgi:hypothetical protein
MRTEGDHAKHPRGGCLRRERLHAQDGEGEDEISDGRFFQHWKLLMLGVPAANIQQP